MTVGELKDYLNQFPDSALVFHDAADVPEQMVEVVPHIVLSVLDYSVEN